MAELNHDFNYRGQEIFITHSLGWVPFVNGWKCPDRFLTVAKAQRDAEAFIDAIMGWEGVEPEFDRDEYESRKWGPE